MKLGDWLAAHGLTHEDFASRIGRDRASVTRYVSGERTPRPATMRRIAEATGNAVTANDFVASGAPDGERRLSA